jgi:hypothetical protein
MRMDQTQGHHRRGGRRDLRRGRPAPHLRALRRGEARRPLRPRHHRGARDAPIERSGNWSTSSSPRRRSRCNGGSRPPRQARLPGAAHRGERRAVGARAGPPAAMGLLRVGGRIVVMSYPVARGPARQARVRGGDGIHRARGTARRTARARAALPSAHERRRARVRRGARRNPVPPRASARGRENRGGAMSIATAPARPRSVRRPAAHRRRAGPPAPRTRAPPPRRRPRLLYGIIAVAGAVLIARRRWACRF